MINIIKNLYQDDIILTAQPIIQHHLVAHLNLNLFLANALLVITTPLLDAINHYIVLLLNHVMNATAVALNYTQIINTNPLLTLLNNPFQ